MLREDTCSVGARLCRYTGFPDTSVGTCVQERCEVWLGLPSVLRTVSEPFLSGPDVLYDSYRKMLTKDGLAGLEQTMGRQSH
jgi:hypothetical protein